MYNIVLLHEMMHPTYNFFLALYLAHLLTDFVFQTTRIVSKKHQGEWRAYLIHGVAKMFGVTGTAGLTLALCRRVRATFWAAVGVTCLILMNRAEDRDGVLLTLKTDAALST